jgi:putative membrane protein
MAGGEIEKIVLALVAVIVIIIVAGALSMTFMMGGGGWGGMMGPGMMGFGLMGWGGMGFGWMMLLPVIFLVILIVGVYFIVTWLRGEDKTSHVPNTALEVVKERYAKGEITAEEFKKMKRDLTG